MDGWILVCVGVCERLWMGVQQTPMHLFRPGDRGKSVLRVLDESRGEAEPGERGWVGVWEGVLGYYCKR